MSTNKTKKAQTPVKQGRGRHRCEEAHQKILKAAYELLDEVGFMALTSQEETRRRGEGETHQTPMWWGLEVPTNREPSNQRF